MDVTNALTPQNNAVAASQPTTTSAVISSDFETFLQMLTTQARYQDPLEPVDSSEFAAQLAQFSMVEQQVLSNDLLAALGSQFGAGNMAQMAGWIGMEARTSAPVRFDSSSLTIAPASEAGADEAVLVVYDASGAEAMRQQIAVGNAPFEWSGIKTDGSQLPPGNYSFAVESKSLGVTTSTIPAESYARITEARRQGEETQLILNGGSSVSASQVGALREPASNTVPNATDQPI